MSAYNDFEFLRTSVEGRILTVTLDRSDALNACRASDHTEMSLLPSRVAQDDDVDVIVITGAGRAFCVGGDDTLVVDIISDESVRRRVEHEARTMIHALVDLDKPVVVALNGFAMGAGLAFALMGDIVVAERGTRFADGHVLLAVTAGDGGTITWPLYAGLLRAKRWLMTGDWITAEDAERIGLVTELADSGEALARATEYARKLAGLPQDAVRSTKRSLNQWLRLGLSTAFDVSIAAEFAAFGSPSVAAHITDFLAQQDARSERSAKQQT
jgi:enoyl-CoA hydratase